jgi:hypothetical protein
LWGLLGPLRCSRGNHSRSKPFFAGYDDFAAYLASKSVEGAPLARHEW